MGVFIEISDTLTDKGTLLSIIHTHAQLTSRPGVLVVQVPRQLEEAVWTGWQGPRSATSIITFDRARFETVGRNFENRQFLVTPWLTKDADLANT